jgi:hypothetical protein
VGLDVDIDVCHSEELTSDSRLMKGRELLLDLENVNLLYQLSCIGLRCAHEDEAMYQLAKQKERFSNC